MKERYDISFIMFPNGERYPLLRNADGKPHWYATLYATTQIRNASKAPNTILAVLTAIRILLAWSQEHKLDLEDRFSVKMFLTEQELESLVQYTQMKVDNDRIDSHESKKLIKKVEQIRNKFIPAEDRISSGTQYIRITYIASYLEWLAIHVVERYAKQLDAPTLKMIQRMANNLRARRPQKSIRSRELARKGLATDQQEALLSLIKPGALNSPFSVELQIRNQLIVLLLYHLGLRAGELLALRISDFDFQKNTVLIARRHDNPEDMRTYQPVVKTIDRRLPVSDSLVKYITEYVMSERRKFPAAKKHDYLFVVHQNGPFLGQPLSLKGLAKVFQEIQVAEPNLFKHLTPHVLRHTANDRFSELMDARGTSTAEEDKMRSYLMGWKEGSGTASTYTRRHIENKAREAALLLQKPIKKGL